MTASGVAFTSLVYEGTTTVGTPGGGTESVLEFSATSAAITDLDMKLGCGTSHAIETFVAPGKSVAATTLRLDVLSLSFAGLPAPYTVANPPSPTAVSLGNPTFSSLDATAAYLTTASLTGPLQFRPAVC